MKSPLPTMLVTLKGAAPVLLNVTSCAALVVPIACVGNPRLATETEANGVGLPMAEREIVCGLFVALSAIVTDPKRLPDTVGVNVTLMVQLAPAATLVGQLLIGAKSPLAVTLEMIRAALPMLVSVTDCAGLVVPIAWLANVRVFVERLTTATACPVPDSGTVWKWPL